METGGGGGGVGGTETSLGVWIRVIDSHKMKAK